MITRIADVNVWILVFGVWFLAIPMAAILMRVNCRLILGGAVIVTAFLLSAYRMDRRAEYQKAKAQATAKKERVEMREKEKQQIIAGEFEADPYGFTVAYHSALAERVESGEITTEEYMRKSQALFAWNGVYDAKIQPEAIAAVAKILDGQAAKAASKKAVLWPTTSQTLCQR